MPTKQRYTELTFGEVTENLNYIKVVWNGTVIFDDSLADVENTSHYSKSYLNKVTGIEGITYVTEHYYNKKIYSMYMRVVASHHCELYIEGEK